MAANIIPQELLNLADEILDSKSEKITESGCVIWTGTTMNAGYGFISYKDVRFLAHRVAFANKYGDIPKGMHVCHKCDVRTCINPDHLFLGTDKENAIDKVKKGRQQKGSEVKVSKLTEEQINEIRKDKRSQSAIAKDYGVHQTAIWKVKNNKSWMHVK